MYKGSFHGNLVMNEQSTNAPTCGDCHGSHAIVSTRSAEFRGSIPSICGRCHHERSFTYSDTYHGQAVELGGTVDGRLHGLSRESQDPAGLEPSEPRLWPHIVATCRKCHPKANALFATYLVHVDRGSPKSSFIIWLSDIAHAALIGVLFMFAGSHCSAVLLPRTTGGALWPSHPLTFGRQGRPTHPAHAAQAVDVASLEYRRFGPFHRWVHFFVMASFTVLVFTGMPLKYKDAGWARTEMDFIGGVQAAGVFHRMAAIDHGLVRRVRVVLLRSLHRRPKGPSVGPGHDRAYTQRLGGHEGDVPLVLRSGTQA